MHARHQSEFVGGRHDRIPIAVDVVNRGQPQGFGVLGEREGRDALGRHALHLLDGQRRIPHGDQHQRDVAPRRDATPILDEPVVVDAADTGTRIPGRWPP